MLSNNLKSKLVYGSLVSVLIALVAGLAPARAPVPPVPPDADIKRFSVCLSAHGVETRGDGELVGLGPDYEIRFLDHGVVFTPALGSAAPANRPLHLTIESIHRGAAPIPLVEAAPASVRGNVVEYERGVGPYRVVERYETRPDGVEQSFVFDDLPAGSGDLVVRSRIDCELRSERTGTFADGLLLAEAGVGGIRIGAVTAIDAAGARAPGKIRFDGQHLELVVPAAFVDGAALPLVVDPLIGTDFTVGGVNNEYRPDAAYDATNDLYLVAWERQFSSTEHRITAQRVHAKGYLVGSPMTLTKGSWAILPRVANVNSRDRFLVAWTEASTMGGSCDVNARTINAASGAVSNVITIAGGAGNQKWVSIGGEATLAGDCAMVVWNELDTQIHGARVQLPKIGDPMVVAPGAFTVGSLGGWSDGFPVISRSGGTTGTYLVAWNRLLTKEESLRGRVIDRNGNFLTTTCGITFSSLAERSKAVAGEDGEWLVVYQREESPGGAQNDIMCRPVRYDAKLGLLISAPETTLAGVKKYDERDPTVAFAGPKYLASWVEDSGSGNTTITYAEMDPTGCMPCSQVTKFPSKTEGHYSPTLVAKRSGDPAANDEGLLTWHYHNPAISPDWMIQAMKWKAIGAGGPVIDLGGGCGKGGSLQANGAAAIGNPDFELVFQGAPLTSLSAIMNLSVPGKPIGCGKCQIVPIQFLFTIPLKGGKAVVPLPIPCAPQFVGAMVQFQFITPFSKASPCPSLDGVSLSNGIEMTLGF